MAKPAVAELHVDAAQSTTYRIDGEYTLKRDLTIPAGISLVVSPGGYINVDSGRTLTIEGHVDAGLYEIFRGEGQVVFRSCLMDSVFPQWFGCFPVDYDEAHDPPPEGSDEVNKQSGINMALRSAGQTKVRLTAGSWFTSGSILLEESQGLALDRNAIIRPRNRPDNIYEEAIVLKSRSRLQGGQIRLNRQGTRFDKSLILLNGNDEISYARVQDIELHCHFNKVYAGILLRAGRTDEYPTAGQFVQMCLFKDIYIDRAMHGIRFLIDGRGDPGAQNVDWLNGNVFENINMRWCNFGIWTEDEIPFQGDGTQNACGGNRFSNIQFQCQPRRYISYVAVDVNNRGDYDSAPQVSLVGGGGAGFSAEAIMDGRRVSEVRIISQGEGYTGEPFVGIQGGGGHGARACAVVTTDVIESADVSAGGNGYVDGESVAFGAGTGGSAVATVDGGVIQRLHIIDRGRGYEDGITVDLTGGSGSGAKATIHTTGGVTAIEIEDGGTGYDLVPKVFVYGSRGTGAVASAEVSGGQVTKINVEDPGTGYTAHPQVMFSGGGGGGAKAEAWLLPHLTHRAARVGSLFNTLEMTVWDFRIDDWPGVEFTCGSESTIAEISGLGSRYIADHGDANRITCDASNGRPGLLRQGAVLPSAPMAPSFCGWQDDFLVNADVRYTVVQTGGVEPESPTAVQHCFFPHPGFPTKWRPKDGRPIEIVVDFSSGKPNSVNGLYCVGVTFEETAKAAQKVKLEYQYGGKAHWTTIGLKPVTTPVVFFTAADYLEAIHVEKIRITLFGVQRTGEVRLNRIFGFSSFYNGEYYMSKRGGHVWGEVDLEGYLKHRGVKVVGAQERGVSAMTNVGPIENLDAGTVTVGQLAAIVGNLIEKLRKHGLVAD